MGGAKQTWAVAGLPKWKPQRNCQDRPWAPENLMGLSYLTSPTLSSLQGPRRPGLSPAWTSWTGILAPQPIYPAPGWEPGMTGVFGVGAGAGLPGSLQYRLCEGPVLCNTAQLTFKEKGISEPYWQRGLHWILKSE